MRVGIAAALASIMLAACGTAGNNVDRPELSDGKVTITFSWWGADARTQLTLQAIKLFEKDHPNITVEPQYADWSGYWDRLATTTAAGEMPDVSQFDELYLASYAQRGALQDLSKTSNILNTSALAPQILDAGRVGNTLYAVPVGAATNGIIINTTLFKKYGVKVPDVDNWTWDEFIKAATDVTKASKGEVHGLSPFGADSFTLTVWARQHGSSLFDDDGKVVVDPAVLAAYWQRELDFIKSGASPSVAQLSEIQGVPLDQNHLATGKTAMGFIPAGQFTAYQSAAPDYDFAIADWPTDPDTKPNAQYLKPSMYWAMSATTEHPAEAALLINFLTNDTRVGALFGTDRGVPANPKFQEAIKPKLDESGQEALAFTTAVTKKVGAAPPITPKGASEVATVLDRYNQQVLYGKATPQAAAQAFIKELQASITAAG
ncbi:sugar ABC transporter substrate-binding protein [Nonomuraea sp. FMUSA5-5]|uniref:Sugar ABC transporter substrate-binding protein n=1 Tax=Nonomuraea composti TaxID=2720023 RepID=A0ABX1BCI1_9ACTN|nr:sugar ABC transporter substrate-binding protein [Nonomuraea sp. FMUSA5-5]NJP95485.1 sugar ABC transporter substrate-binding protein [Nonomuraea sp. FMUSA5-5]